MPAHDPIEAAAFAVDSADRARQRALRYLNVFRLILGGLFLVAGEEFGLGSESPRLRPEPGHAALRHADQPEPER